MKKVCMMLAAFGAFALIAGEKLDVNGKFAGSVVGAKEPKGWVYNTGIEGLGYNYGTKSVGTGEVVKVGEAFGVKIVNPTKESQFHYFYNKFFPVTAGEVYRVSVEATGTGFACIGIYFCNEKGRECGSLSKVLYLPESKHNNKHNKFTVSVKKEFTVPEELGGKKPTKARFAFFVQGKSEVVFKNVEVEKK